MVENTFHYNYDVKFCEKYYLTRNEAIDAIREARESAKIKSHAVIMTGTTSDKSGLFDAYTADKLSHNFTWIHFCPQEILNFDDDEPQEGNYYVMTFEGTINK